jgi:hypothetical protein
LIQFNLDTNQDVLNGASDVLEITETVLNSAALSNVAGVVTLPVGTWEICGEATANCAAGVPDGTLALHVDGAITSPAVYTGGAGVQNKPFNMSLTGVVISDGTTTCAIVFTNASSTTTVFADQCRLTLRAC